MDFIVKLLTTTVLVVLLGRFLPGIAIDSFETGLLVALVLGLLNMFLKPILVFLTLPATVISLGLFIFVINAVIVMLSSYFVKGFYVSGFWTALLFSIVLAILQSIINGFLGENESNKTKNIY